MAENYKSEIINQFSTNNLSEFISDDLIEKLDKVQNMILEKNAVMNLTAITKEPEFIFNHWVDAFNAVKLIQNNSYILDVGTGGGIIAFACALSNKNLKVVCIDSTGKKIDFINYVIKELKIDNLIAISSRAEEYIKNNREKFDYVIARAVANLPVLSELCIPYVKVGGVFIAMKGKNAQTELDESQNAIKELGASFIKDEISLLKYNDEEIVRHNLIIKKKTKTNVKYPRQYSAIVKHHL